MIERTIKIKIERAGQLSLSLFNGEKYLIDLSRNGIAGNIRTENLFQELAKALDERVFSGIVLMNLQPKISLEPKGKG